MTTETTATQKESRYSLVIGLIIGFLVSALYGFITIGPIKLDSDFASAFLCLISVVVGIIGLLPRPYLIKNQRLSGSEQVIDPDWSPPSKLMVGLAFGMLPIWVGTLVYGVGCWLGWWN